MEVFETHKGENDDIETMIKERNNKKNRRISFLLLIIIVVVVSIVLSLVSFLITYFVMKKKIKTKTIYPYGDPNKITYVFGHNPPDTDTIASAITVSYLEEQIGSKNKLIPITNGDLSAEIKFVLNKFGVNAPEKKTDLKGADGVILVDHNDFKASFPEAGSSNVLKVYDHHSISFSFSEPMDFTTRKYGCCCTLLYEIFMDYGITIPQHIAGLMVSAIISDTLLLKGTTTTEFDIKATNELSKIAKIDYNEYGKELILVATDYSKLTDAELIMFDCKKFSKKKGKYRLNESRALDKTNSDKLISERKEGILKAINTKLENETDVDLFVFYIVNINDLETTFIVLGSKTYFFEKAFNVTLIDNMAVLKGKVSRKMDINPPLEKIFDSDT